MLTKWEKKNSISNPNILNPIVSNYTNSEIKGSLQSLKPKLHLFEGKAINPFYFMDE
jgi:hypothetical protein